MEDAQEKGLFESALQNFLSPILSYLHDPEVSEILINGPHEVFCEKNGKLFRVEAQFHDEDALQAAVVNIAQSVGRRISEKEPQLDARLPDGSRIHAVFPPCSRGGTVVSIRKFLKSNMTLKDYLQKGSISKDGALFLDACMHLGKNILVSGGTGSGKTTLLSVLCQRIPKGQRLIVIEDASELTIDYEHVVRFETRMGNHEGDGAVDMRDLLKSSLRLRPDRIILGEVRGAEAMELISAMNTGHKGCMGTIHANSPYDAILRLEALAMSSDGKISEKAVQQQIASAVHLVVQIDRQPDGSRRIAAISEVIGCDKGQYELAEIFHLNNMTSSVDAPYGELKATGTLPTFMEEMEIRQIPFPRSKFSQAA